MLRHKFDIATFAMNNMEKIVSCFSIKGVCMKVLNNN